MKPLRTVLLTHAFAVKNLDAFAEFMLRLHPGEPNECRRWVSRDRVVYILHDAVLTAEEREELLSHVEENVTIVYATWTEMEDGTIHMEHTFVARAAMRGMFNTGMFDRIRNAMIKADPHADADAVDRENGIVRLYPINADKKS